MGKKMTVAQMDGVAYLHFLGTKSAEIAARVGFSEAGVQNVIKTISLVKEGEDEELAAIIVRRSMGKNMILWAYERSGREIPPVVTEALAKLQERRNRGIPEQTSIEELRTAPVMTQRETFDWGSLHDLIYSAVYKALMEVKKADE